MTDTEVLLQIVHVANAGGAMRPEDAVSHVAALINRVDMGSASYEREVRDLLRIGACIWQLHRD